MCSDERPVPDRNRSLFKDNFSILEVKTAVRSAKRGKSCRFDEIPSEVLNNDASIYFLHVLFNVCFNKGVVPAVWGKCVIKPIPKASSKDPRDALSYRGISLASITRIFYRRQMKETVAIEFNIMLKTSEEKGPPNTRDGTTQAESQLIELANRCASRKKLSI